MYIYIYIIVRLFSYLIYLPVVPHKAVAEVSKIGTIGEVIVVMNGWLSEPIDGSKGG